MVWFNLTNDAGENLQLDVLGYSSAADKSDLVSVLLKGKTAEFAWQTESPCFMLSELTDIADWLTDLTESVNGDIPPLQFMDPSITFVADIFFGKDRKLQILLLGDMHPQKWAADDELTLEFVISPEELNRLSGSLKEIASGLPRKF